MGRAVALFIGIGLFMDWGAIWGPGVQQPWQTRLVVIGASGFFYYLAWWLYDSTRQHSYGPYVAPVVTHVELYWPGHGNGPDYSISGGWYPTLDVYIRAQHNRHVSDRWSFGKPPGTRLTIMEDNSVYRYEIPLQDPYSGDINLAGMDVYEVNADGTYKHDGNGNLICHRTPKGMKSTWAARERSEAVDWAKAFGWRKNIPEIGRPEDAFKGRYGT